MNLIVSKRFDLLKINDRIVFVPQHVIIVFVIFFILRIIDFIVYNKSSF